MEFVPLKPERMAQLQDYAQRRSQSPVDALDEALGTYLERERVDSEEAIQGIRRGYEDVKAGRTRPSAELIEHLRTKLI